MDFRALLIAAKNACMMEAQSESGPEEAICIGERVRIRLLGKYFSSLSSSLPLTKYQSVIKMACSMFTASPSIRRWVSRHGPNFVPCT